MQYGSTDIAALKGTHFKTNDSATASINTEKFTIAENTNATTSYRTPETIQ
jgi:hypothetical protein